MAIFLKPAFIRRCLFSRCTLLAVGFLAPLAAFAHSAERGLVMLLPTKFMIAGGTTAVGVTFMFLALVPGHRLQRMTNARIRLFSLGRISPFFPSLMSFGFLLYLLAAGILGTTDPLRNPLTLTIWTLWWVGFTLLQFFVGDLWNMCNPWYAPLRILRWMLGNRPAPLAWPERLGYLPAIVLFFGFAWFELVYPAPEDPWILAMAVLIYVLITLAGMLLFGYREWMQRGESFAIFFRLVGDCSPLIRTCSDDRRVTFFLGWPGQGFLERKPMPITGVLFVLLTLSASSFDGLAETFTWLGLMGVNPLEHPGRSALVGMNSLGLLGAFAVLSTLYLFCAWLGSVLAARVGVPISGIAAFSGRLVYSIVPIAVAFHIAHYLTLLLINGQYALVAFTDPFNLGWNLFGLADDFHVTVSFLNNIHDVSLIWVFQTTVIVLGHVIGVTMAHLIALSVLARPAEPVRAATRSQIPMAMLMVGYTAFGLWLLSTATVG